MSLLFQPYTIKDTKCILQAPHDDTTCMECMGDLFRIEGRRLQKLLVDKEIEVFGVANTKTAI